MPYLVALAAASAFLTSNVAVAAGEPACAPLGLQGDALETWRAGGFAGEDADRAARDLSLCLGAADPYLRDRIGFEGLASVLRAGGVSPEARRALIARSVADLSAPDPTGVARPFAALALAELARTDRIEPFLAASERDALALAAARYLEGVEDYRAFDDAEGWRHGVAHGADLVLQLALNEAVSAAQLRRMRDAVAAQVSPAGVAYLHGEANRLARPIAYMAQRDDLSPDEWRAWLTALADPSPLEDWNAAFRSETDLIRVHNMRAFALALYAYASNMEGEAAKALAADALRVAAAIM